MNEENKNLKLARIAREENNQDDAKKYYGEVVNEDPDNGEARFFNLYYALQTGTNGEIPDRLVNIVKALETSVKLVSLSQDTVDEKLDIIEEITKTYTPLVWSLYKYIDDFEKRNPSREEYVIAPSKVALLINSGVVGLYNLGDYIRKYFPGNAKADNLALIPWKEAIRLHQKWRMYPKFHFNNIAPEDYAAKVKLIDNSYEMPRKSGCIGSISK